MLNQATLEPAEDGLEMKTNVKFWYNIHLEMSNSTLAWRTLWAEKPGRLQSMGSLRVGHD